MLIKIYFIYISGIWSMPWEFDDVIDVQIYTLVVKDIHAHILTSCCIICLNTSKFQQL